MILITEQMNILHHKLYQKHHKITIAIRLKIQTKSGHKPHKSEL